MRERRFVAQAIRMMTNGEIEELAREIRVSPEKLRQWAWDYPVETEKALEAAREVH